MSKKESRKVKTLKKNIKIFCEGKTEYNYFNHFKRLFNNISISIEPINMDGGGYSSFLDKVKTSSKANCLAKFVIIDYDRALTVSGEMNHLKKMIEYARNEAKKKSNTPIFIIIDNPNFEYISCLHFNDYRNSDTESYIFSKLHLNKEEFKGKENVFELLNPTQSEYQNMLEKVGKHVIINNQYNINNNGIINIDRIDTDYENGAHKDSNIDEVFHVMEELTN